MRAHRLPANVDGYGENPEQEVGHDVREFPSGVNHVASVPVGKTKPVIKEGVGPYIPNNIQGPGAWHGEEPTISASATHDQYLQADHMATHAVHETPQQKYYPDPVPVVVVPPDSSSETMTVGRGNMMNVDVTDTGSQGSAVQIVPRDMHRSRVTIRNEHATIGVRIGGSREEAKYGFLLTAGDARDFNQQTGIWAWPSDGVAVIPISYMGEYSRNV